MKHIALLLLGSNTRPAYHLGAARRWLESHFDGVEYGEEMETAAEPTGEGMYHNQAVRVASSLALADLLTLLGQGEKELGRTEDDKSLHTIHIDIDLLQYDDHVLRPSDLHRTYVAKCLETLY